MTRRVAIRTLTIVGLLLLTYVVALVIVGWAIEGKVKRGMAERMSKSLDAEVTIDDVSVSLLRGKVEVRGIKIERGGTGFVKIQIGALDADIPSMGMAVFGSTLDMVSLRDVNILLSPLALRKRKKAEPLVVGGLEVKNLRISLVPTPLIPHIGRVEATIDYARCSAMEMRSGLSFLFHLQVFRAHADLPRDVSLDIVYEREHLTLNGPILGGEPLRMHFPLPKPNPDQLETAQALALGKAVAKNLAKGGGLALLQRFAGKSKAPPPPPPPAPK